MTSSSVGRVAADERGDRHTGRRRTQPVTEPPPTPAWWRSAVDLLVVSVVVASAVPWLLSGGIPDLLGPERWTVLGRLLGIISAALVLLQVLFMARIPLLEKAVGHVELVSWHRRLGIWSIGTLVAHLLLIGFGYAGGALGQVLGTLVSLVQTTHTMPMATLATVGLLLVYVTSMPPVRGLLSYEWWHLVHLYGYIGAGFAVPHEVVLGGSLEDHPMARAVWISAWVVTAVAVIVWRVAIPLIAMQRHDFVVRRVVREAPGVWSLYVQGRDIDALGVRAGQFFFVRFVQGMTVGEAHPYSISAAPRRNQLRFTVKELGDASAQIGSIRPGTRVLLEGPYGRLTGEVRSRRRVLLLAAGIGVTPVRALLEGLTLRRGEATVIYRASTDREIVFKSEIEQLVEETGSDLFFLVGPRHPRRLSFLPAGSGRRRDSEVLRELVPDVSTRDVYLCGSGPWADAAVAACMEAGVPPERLHVESFV